MLFGIVDARHACDQRFWVHVLPPFFFTDEYSRVMFQRDICLVQLAHNYLGMKCAAAAMHTAPSSLRTRG